MRTPAQIMADVAAQHATEDDQRAQERVWPAPERLATPTTDLPRGPKAIAALCEAWKATSARGPVAANGHPGWRMADSVLLKGRVGQRYFSALWIEDAKGGMTFSLAYGHGVPITMNSTQLKHYLTADLGIPWVEGVGFVPRITRNGDN